MGLKVNRKNEAKTFPLVNSMLYAITLDRMCYMDYDAKPKMFRFIRAVNNIFKYDKRRIVALERGACFDELYKSWRETTVSLFGDKVCTWYVWSSDVAVRQDKRVSLVNSKLYGIVLTLVTLIFSYFHLAS